MSFGGWLGDEARAFLRRRRQNRARSRRRIRAARPPKVPPTIAPMLDLEVDLGFEVGLEVEMSRVAGGRPVGANRPRYVRRSSLSKPPTGVVSVAAPVPLRSVSGIRNGCSSKDAYLPPMTSVTLGGTLYSVIFGTS